MLRKRCYGCQFNNSGHPTCLPVHVLASSGIKEVKGKRTGRPLRMDFLLTRLFPLVECSLRYYIAHWVLLQRCRRLAGSESASLLLA
jgi:hypothetical protein